jgi:hypothetical protein
VVPLEAFISAVQSLELPYNVLDQKNVKMLYHEFGGTIDGIQYKQFIDSLKDYVPTERSDTKPPSPPKRNPVLTSIEDKFAESGTRFAAADITDNEYTRFDIQKVPVNVLDNTIARARRVRKILRTEFHTKNLFNGRLDNLVKNQNGNLTFD